MKENLSLRTDYWDNFEFRDTDLEFLYNHLIEVETPQTTQELLRALVEERINLEKRNMEKQRIGKGQIYYPKEHYDKGQKLIFPSLGWREGQVIETRKGYNPEMDPFEVITVKFADDETHLFAATLDNHTLNTPVMMEFNDPLLNVDYVLKQYGQKLTALLNNSLENKPDLVRIAGRWFPRTLLVDINIGYLNLAEALLDMNNGGPLPTSAIMDQIELPKEANSKLMEFSLNLALQEDGRFDEVGPAGKVLWYLRRLEPDCVRETPIYLQSKKTEADQTEAPEVLEQIRRLVMDEFEPAMPVSGDENEVTISLIYPHWRAGALPLAGALASLFPTAYESPRVLSTFVDVESGNRFPAWIVREAKYVYGLENWYKAQGVIPGSYVHLTRGKTPGEVNIKAEKKRAARDWIRTALVGADGEVVFAMIKQLIATAYDERMAVYIPDVEALDQVWHQIHKQKTPLEQIVLNTMRELAKLNPQGHIHALELYAAVNIFHRYPPSAILGSLFATKKATYLGDLYFRLLEAQE
ncbi:MAG: hypothetical protein HPY45_10515 [Anaerolineae bacterium]|nr:hypothetical protein [Anaerolineae bacterium]